MQGGLESGAFKRYPMLPHRLRSYVGRLLLDVTNVRQNHGCVADLKLFETYYGEENYNMLQVDRFLYYSGGKLQKVPKCSLIIAISSIIFV